RLGPRRDGQRSGGGAKPAPLQAGAEPRPAARQPRLKRPDGTAKTPGGLFVAQTLEVTEYDRRLVARRESGELLMDFGPGLGLGGAGLGVGGFGRFPLAGASASGVGVSPRGDAAGDSVKPGGE